MKKLILFVAVIATSSCTEKCAECEHPAPQFSTYEVCQQDIRRNQKFSDVIDEVEAYGYKCRIYSQSK